MDLSCTAIDGRKKKMPARKSWTAGLFFLWMFTVMSLASAQQKPNLQPQDSLAEKANSISLQQATYLVRSVLLRLNDANLSGNYTVLRDLAAPDFQGRNSAADLAQSFSDLRRRNFDLFAVALLPPQFTAEPVTEKDGKARLTGFFSTRPLLIRFDLTFQPVSGQWRLYTISVATPEASNQQSGLAPSSRPGSSRLFYSARLFNGRVGWRW